VPDALPLLQMQGITAGYRGSAVLQDLDIVVAAQGVTGIIGPNGAGKSTLLKTLLGYLQPDVGEIRFADRSITALAPEARTALGIAYIAQTRSYFPSQTVQENLRLGAYLVRDAAVRRARQEAVFERFPILAERRRQKAGLLSGGEARILEIGRMLMMAPRLAILDEPSIGLSPRMVDVVYEHIAALRDEGMTFLIVEQNVRKLFAIADHVFALESGRNRFAGTPAMLTDRGVLAELYLGHAAPASGAAG
jgi:branched-chain amino acid transport system ATP-binding protein